MKPRRQAIGRCHIHPDLHWLMLIRMEAVLKALEAIHSPNANAALRDEANAVWIFFGRSLNHRVQFMQ